MIKMTNIPSKSYGILQQETISSPIDEAVEQVKNLGYTVLDSGFKEDELNIFSNEFNQTREQYLLLYGESYLKEIGEFDMIRAPLTFGSEAWLKLALNKNLHSLLQKLIVGKYILHQQNGLVNPPGSTYVQFAWHRDLPYQHFTSSTPLAVNALFCVDDFTEINGATHILPASHKSITFPSAAYIKKNSLQIEAKAGSFIVLDCMLFHSGGLNKSIRDRRAVNHVYSIPYFKQQINIPSNMSNTNLTEEQRELLGFNCMEPSSLTQYFKKREK